jgi:hypothetical protein
MIFVLAKSKNLPINAKSCSRRYLTKVIGACRLISNSTACCRGILMNWWQIRYHAHKESLCTIGRWMDVGDFFQVNKRSLRPWNRIRKVGIEIAEKNNYEKETAWDNFLIDKFFRFKKSFSLKYLLI